ncbi:bacillithiol system redox-active protein YtxJ [Salinibacter altiplanensis]|uniref:bacillithiol system redox-active protein YtxJ n=1 Tax=Salinibacter altiplanensis TaxID=1803181 RepID=UPI000C9F4D8E|nr:bacillithiol system redox-active protein YtxJ [Salinibacter altiplanensis]
MSDSPFRPLSTDASWAEAQSASEDRPVLVFKHSSACPVSAKADKQLHALAEDSALPVYKIVVQDSRALSDEIAEALDVRHETPQAIVLDDETPVFEASHFDVTADAVREAVQSASSSTN